MKRIMIIAGGTWQVPLIRKAKELGYEVVNSNLYEDSPGFKFSDFAEVCDVRDKKRNLEIAKKYNILGVLTDQSDIAVPTVAYVAENMGCPTIGSEMAELFTNKFRMREFCYKKGFASPEYKVCNTVEEAIDFLEKINKKVVIKPLDSQSSRGVFTVERIEELEEKFPVSQSFSSDKREVLIERYVSGKEFTIDGILFEGKHHSLAISEKAHFKYNQNIASELLFSYDSESYDYDLLRETHNRLIEQTGLLFGLTHAEYKYENGEFYLIEMAARGGGTKIASDIVPYMSGIDTYKILIDSALKNGSSTNFNFTISKRFQKRWAILRFLDVESNGKAIVSIEGIDKIKALDGVKDFALEFSIGDIVEHAQDDRSRVGYYIACAESKEEIEIINETINKFLKISFE